MNISPNVNLFDQETMRNIIRYSDFRTLQSIRQTNVHNFRLVEQELRDTITLLIKPFLNPLRLHLFLTATKSVISGSAALAFLMRTFTWKPGDLDIYVPKSMETVTRRYLTKYEEYKLVGIHRPTEDSRGYLGGIHKILFFMKGTLSVDIIISDTESPLHPIPYFWATHVMNFIGSNFFGSLYPLRTLEECGLLNVDRPGFSLDNPRIVELMDKYHDRGFQFALRPISVRAADDPSVKCMLRWDCPRSARWIGDQATLLNHLNDNCSARISVPYTWDVLPRPLTVMWWLGGHCCGGTCRARPGELAKHLVDTVELEHALEQA